MKKTLRGVQPWSDGAGLIPRNFNDEPREWKVVSISDVNAKDHATAKIQAVVESKTVSFLIDACTIPHKEVEGTRTWNIDSVTLRFDDGRMTVV